VSQVIDEMQAFYLCTMSWLAGILKVLDLIVIIAIIHAGLLQEAAPVKAPPSGDLQLGNRTAGFISSIIHLLLYNASILSFASITIK
jgi:hypothetical protein